MQYIQLGLDSQTALQSRNLSPARPAAVTAYLDDIGLLLAIPPSALPVASVGPFFRAKAGDALRVPSTLKLRKLRRSLLQCWFDSSPW